MMAKKMERIVTRIISNTVRFLDRTIHILTISIQPFPTKSSNND